MKQRIYLALTLSLSSACQSTMQQNSGHLSYEKISIQSLDATPLEAVLYKPQGPGPFPAIVALHGCAGMYRKGGKLSPRDLSWGKRLSEKGYVVIYPDSFTTRKIDEICTKKNMAKMWTKIRPLDAYGALQWLQSQSYVQKERIALMGWSNGGSTLLSALDQNSDAPPENLEHDFKTAIAFYPGCKTANRDPQWHNRIPVEILMGELDNWVSPPACQNLVQHSNQKPKLAMTLYPDSYHDFDNPDAPLLVLHNLAYTENANHSATVGSNKKAREESIKKVYEILKETL
jgi:dienelactone hydrolase